MSSVPSIKDVSEQPIPKVKCFQDLSEILSTLPRLSEDEAAGFAADLEVARAEISGSQQNPWGGP
jgi:hypothetical protein